MCVLIFVLLNYRLQCRFTAEPEAAVTWRVNGVELSSNQHLSLAADASQSTLTIDNVTLGDTGEYTCTAVNNLGEAATKTFLRIRSELSHMKIFISPKLVAYITNASKCEKKCKYSGYT